MEAAARGGLDRGRGSREGGDRVSPPTATPPTPRCSSNSSPRRPCSPSKRTSRASARRSPPCPGRRSSRGPCRRRGACTPASPRRSPPSPAGPAPGGAAGRQRPAPCSERAGRESRRGFRGRVPPAVIARTARAGSRRRPLDRAAADGVPAGVAESRASTPRLAPSKTPSSASPRALGVPCAPPGRAGGGAGGGGSRGRGAHRVPPVLLLGAGGGPQQREGGRHRQQRPAGGPARHRAAAASPQLSSGQPLRLPVGMGAPGGGGCARDRVHAGDLSEVPSCHPVGSALAPPEGAAGGGT